MGNILIKISFFIFFAFSSLIGQINISLPDLTEENNARITIPVEVSDLSNLRVRSYKFRVKFDQNILKFREIEDRGTISDAWTWDVDSDLEDDGLYIEAQGWLSLSGSGTLIYLKFKVIGNEGFTALELDPVYFNNGNIDVTADHGSFRVYAEKEIKFVGSGNGSGGISINGDKFSLPYKTKLVQGLEYTVQAFPETGSVFERWSGALNSSQNPYQFEVKDNSEITAEFSLRSYSVAASIQPEGFGAVNGIGIYEYGETASLSAIPYSGKEFTGWEIAGDLVSEQLEFNTKIIGDLNIVANFKSTLLEISAESYPMNAGQINGTGYYYHNETAVLEAISNENWRFDNWMENGEFISSDSVITLVVDANKSLTANFERIPDLTGLNENPIIANDFYMHDPYPNPFNPSTKFRFGLPEAASVNFYILDLSGKIIKRIYESSPLNSGSFEISFTSENLSSGVYLYYFDAVSRSNNKMFSKKGKLILLK